MTDAHDEQMKQLRRFEHAEETIATEDYETEIPITHEPGMCRKCNTTYTEEEFFALQPPVNGKAEWTYEPDSPVVLAVRQCACGNTLCRRTK
jgi:hypothetical protein